MNFGGHTILYITHLFSLVSLNVAISNQDTCNFLFFKFIRHIFLFQFISDGSFTKYFILIICIRITRILPASNNTVSSLPTATSQSQIFLVYLLYYYSITPILVAIYILTRRLGFMEIKNHQILVTYNIKSLFLAHATFLS